MVAAAPPWRLSPISSHWPRIDRAAERSSAIREVSVVIGAFAGWKILGEKLGPLRIIGAVIIFAGIS